MPDTANMMQGAVDRIGGRFELELIEARPLESITTGTTLGQWQALGSQRIDKAVLCEVTFEDGESPEQIQLFHVMSRPATLTPHLMVECSTFLDTDGTASQVELTLDLIPRVDLGVNPDYVEEVYVPLTAALDTALALPGVSSTRLLRRRSVAMSPWRLSVTAPPQQFDGLEAAIKTYIDHWMAVVSGGVGSDVDPVASDPSKLIQHDRYQRDTLFAEKTDPMWSRIYSTFGPDEAAELRLALRSQESR